MMSDISPARKKGPLNMLDRPLLNFAFCIDLVMVLSYVWKSIKFAEIFAKSGIFRLMKISCVEIILMWI